MKNKYCKCWAIIFVMALFTFTFNLFAQTNVVALPVVTPEVSAPWWVQLLYVTASAAGMAVVWVGKLIITKLKFSQVQADAMDAMTAAVAQTYQDIVKDLKKAGTFTPAAQAAAKERAINMAKDIAKGPAKDLLLSYGKEHLGAWIEMIVTKLKGGTKLENGVAPVVTTTK